MVRVAVLVCGRIQAWGACWPDLKLHFFDRYDASVFLSHNPSCALDDVEGFVKTFPVVRASCEDAAAAPVVPPHAVVPDWNHHHILSSRFHLKRAFDSMLEFQATAGYAFDVVLFLRADTVLFRDLVLPPLSALRDDTVFIPHSNDWAGINDQLACGSPAAMQVYSNLYDFLAQYSVDEKVRYDPETLTQYHLNKHGIHVTRFALDYTLHHARK